MVTSLNIIVENGQLNKYDRNDFLKNNDIKYDYLFNLCYSKNTKPLFIATQTRMTIVGNVENLDKIFFKH